MSDATDDKASNNEVTLTPTDVELNRAMPAFCVLVVDVGRVVSADDSDFVSMVDVRDDEVSDKLEAEDV